MARNRKGPRSKPSTLGTRTMRMQRIRRKLRMVTHKSLVPVQSARKRVRRETPIIRGSARREVRARVNKSRFVQVLAYLGPGSLAGPKSY